MSNNTIKLGNEIRDQVTGIVGIATSLSTELNAARRVGLQMKSKAEGSGYPEAVHVDLAQIEYVGDGIAGAHQDVPTEQYYNLERNLGRAARHSTSGIKGTVVAVTLFLNGCIYYMIQPAAAKKADRRPPVIHDSHAVFEIAGQKVPHKPAKRGGPVTAVQR